MFYYYKARDKENRFVARVFSSSQSSEGAFIWPSLFVSKTISDDKYCSVKSFTKLLSFYACPLAVTSMVSVFLYPKVAYIVKRTLRVKSFLGINLSVAPILILINTNVFCTVQTIIGFKFIRDNAEKARNRDNKGPNEKVYHTLCKKYN